jgi:hypothetical protein
MLLDSIIICIAYILTVSQEVLLSILYSYRTMGGGGWVRAGYWPASSFVLLTGQEYWAVLQWVLLIKPELFVLPSGYRSVQNLNGWHGLPRWI